MIEIEWPDVTSLDRSAFSEPKKRSDRALRTGEALEATLYLHRRKARAPAG